MENISSLVLDKNLVDKSRDIAAVHLVAYKQRIEMLYNKHVKFHKFKKGKLVLRVAMDFQKENNVWKMAEIWEGSNIFEMFSKGA